VSVRRITSLSEPFAVPRFVDPTEDLARYKRKMRVLNVTEQKFGAGVDEHRAHEARQ
jgi:hypothetical protein